MFVFMTYNSEWKLAAKYQTNDEIYQNHQMYDIVFKDYLIFHDPEKPGILLNLDSNFANYQQLILGDKIADIASLAKIIIRSEKIDVIFFDSQV
jgi:hypothetical protein